MTTSMTAIPTTTTISTAGLDAASSWLSERLSDGSHPDAERAFEAARETFISGQRIDMSSLAASLGVDRTSLFRWVGNRDALLSEVLWSLAIPTLAQAEHTTAELDGGERVVGILTHFVDDLITADYFRQFLRREPARALRLLTTKESPIQRRYVATTEWLVRRDLGAAPLGGTIDPLTLAYLLVRVSESFSYTDLISGDQPSSERARTAFRMLLRVDG
ncbi:AcrR family transcriptional regulator [Microbacterium halimionae]|uniref:AcrR family transcriptional regulator n=1 Tax=Microbacterium halimionae TaxID=1526413 RepID=A0A7W3PME8_9MICO|nr:QsdR family transcriptional regulator [Microbacterium halimionae]MBA8817545.1 AcrR family transcriptional regulator [Microbacterium halimionae]NII95012.1 AcrR family transcriptional regulator [Microbacterium halimionae]